MNLLDQLYESRDLLLQLTKYAFQPPPGMPMGNTAPVGAPPPQGDPSVQGDPAMMQQGPPPPGDPAMMQGDPSMMQGDPAMMQGDPSMQGPPPGDPAMQGPPPGDPAMQQIDPNQLMQMLQQMQQATDKTLAMVQRVEQQQTNLDNKMQKTREEFAVVKAMSQMASKAMQQPSQYDAAPGLNQAGPRVGGPPPAQ